MQITTSINNSTNIIGQRYEVISIPSHTPYWQTLSDKTPYLNIKVSIESPFNNDLPELHQNSLLLAKCLTMLSMLFATSTAGLQEASEALENMVEYYKDNVFDSLQTSLPQESRVVKANIVSSEIRPPLVIDLD